MEYFLGTQTLYIYSNSRICSTNLTLLHYNKLVTNELLFHQIIVTRHYNAIVNIGHNNHFNISIYYIVQSAFVKINKLNVDTNNIAITHYRYYISTVVITTTIKLPLHHTTTTTTSTTIYYIISKHTRVFK